MLFVVDEVLLRRGQSLLDRCVVGSHQHPPCVALNTGTARLRPFWGGKTEIFCPFYALSVFDPTRTLRSIHSTCLSALVTDWAMETWYRSASKYPTSCWHWRTRWSTDVTREGGLKMKRPRRQFLHLAAGA